MRGASSVSWRASHYHVDDIDAAQHPHELERKKQDFAILRPDAGYHRSGTGSYGPSLSSSTPRRLRPSNFTYYCIRTDRLTRS